MCKLCNLRICFPGKKFKDQRAFRMKWLKQKIDEIDKTRETAKVTTEGMGLINENQGEYMPFDCIADKEGGAKRPAAITAALNYALACVKFHKTGQAAGPGAPWLAYHTMTKRWEYLYLKKTINDFRFYN